MFKEVSLNNSCQLSYVSYQYMYCTVRVWFWLKMCLFIGVRFMILVAINMQKNFVTLACCSTTVVIIVAGCLGIDGTVKKWSMIQRGWRIQDRVGIQFWEKSITKKFALKNVIPVVKLYAYFYSFIVKQYEYICLMKVVNTVPILVYCPNELFLRFNNDLWPLWLYATCMVVVVSSYPHHLLVQPPQRHFIWENEGGWEVCTYYLVSPGYILGWPHFVILYYKL